jgi:SAM-dependent methyltransferase
MNTANPVERGRYQGVAEIFAFNRHWYSAGMVAAVGAATVLALFDWPTWVRFPAAVALGVAVVWMTASLAVSHWVYDRSPLRTWKWTEGALSRAPMDWCNLHCGLDESSASLRRIFPEAQTVVLDIFDPVQMTEPSIERARAIHSDHRSTSASFRQLPLPPASTDAVFLLFAAHELRRAAARGQLFAELHRVLRDGGEVIVAEHLRGFANFCAFGPGAFHFFSRREWLRVFGTAGLQLRREFSITPFVRVFVLRKGGNHDTGVAS